MKNNLLKCISLLSLSLLCAGCVKDEGTGIVISSENNERVVRVGDTIKLTATIYSENKNQEIVWSSNDEAVATVDQNGLVSALKVGRVKIKASFKDDESVYQEFYLIVDRKEVVEVAPTSLEITCEGNISTLKVAESLSLTATVYPQEAPQGVNWTVSDSTVARVSAGVVTGLKEGVVEVKAQSRKYADIYDTYTLTIEKNDDPTISRDWANMPYSTHDNYMTCDAETLLKVKGVVTHITPLKSGKVNYFIQNGTEGYYVYSQDTTLYPVELGKSYDVGGLKKNYNGLQEIVNVEYCVESATSYSYTINDISGLDASSTSAMAPYHASYVSATATLVSVPSVGTKAYDVPVTIEGKNANLRVDPAYMSTEEFNSINAIFKSLVAGKEIGFKAFVTAYGKNTDPVNQFQIVKSSDLDLGEISASDKVTATLNSLTIEGSIAVDDTTIDLPKVGNTYEDVAITWSSNSELIDIATGTVSHAANDTTVELTATVKCGDQQETATFKVFIFGNSVTINPLAKLDLEDASTDNNWGNSVTKPSYAAAEVELGTPVCTWYLQNALISSTASDKYDGIYGIRAQSKSTKDTTGRIEIREDDEYNIVQFDAAVYGSEGAAIVKVEYSTDAGTTWIDSGLTLTVSSAQLQTYRVTLPEGVKRVAIYIEPNTGNRICFDNIILGK